MPTGTEEYDAPRAAEYDQADEKLERQEDVAALAHPVTNALARRDVLDIAAGTGSWTERLADVPRSTVVFDRLADGREWEVRKDLPPAEEAAARSARHGAFVEVTSTTSCWAATVRTPDGR